MTRMMTPRQAFNALLDFLTPTPFNTYNSLFPEVEKALPKPFDVKTSQETGLPETRFDAWVRYFESRPNAKELGAVCTRLTLADGRTEQHYRTAEWNMVASSLRRRQRLAFGILTSLITTNKPIFTANLMKDLSKDSAGLSSPTEAMNIAKFACLLGVGDSNISPEACDTAVEAYRVASGRDWRETLRFPAQSGASAAKLNA